jgi:small-conductance mechanosensitive channel
VTDVGARIGRVAAEIDLVPAAFAGAAILFALAIGWAAGRWLGPMLADLWERKAGSRADGIGPRMCALVRYLAIWLVVALVLRLRDWPDLSAVMLGLTAAGAAALIAVQIIRGLHLARWIAALLGAFLFVAILADAVGGLAPISEALDRVGFDFGRRRFSLLSLIQIAVALLALYAAVRLANRLVGHSIKRSGALDPTQQLLAQKIAAIVIVIAAFFIGIDVVGIDLTALAVFSGALGLAVGFGLQKTVGNLFAGIILLMDRSIKPGDVISVGQSFGSVNKIGVRAVSIVTREGKEHLIPNEILMTEEVVNWSYSTREVRVSIPVGVSYASDIALAQRLMVEAATASARVLANPKPNVWLTAFGDSAVEHEIRVWIGDPEAGIGPVRSEILNRVWTLFKENGIAIPFPQRDIHVKSWPEPPAGFGA